MNQENNDLRIEALSEQVDLLKARVASLEKELGEMKMAGADVRQAPAAAPPGKPIIIKAAKTADASPDEGRGQLAREGWETLIGGKLLNRLGIIVLLLAAAYFLKYSIDNGWIGITGRIVIGFIAGIAFLGVGDVMMRKGYNWFSQGLSGGGIGIIYITTFFAVTQYHLIGRMPGFALLVLTAAAGGVLAVRQNAYGVGLLSTIGGFLSPFLIGSQAPNTAGLLGYITVLDLAILFAARYKNWRSLNHMAFWGTMLVYIINWANNHIGFHEATLSSESIWVYQLFATVFFLIFGVLSFYNNVRNRESTGGLDVLLLVLNAAFFFGFTYSNFDEHYGDWMGFIAILLAAAYLLVATALKRRQQGDDLLFLALLGTGLAFVTVAIPLQLSEDWIGAAWLVEAAVLVFAGLKGKNVWVRWAGVLLLWFVSMAYSFDYAYYYNEELPVPIFNAYSITCLLAIAGWFLTAYWFQTSEDTHSAEKYVVWPAAFIGTFLTLKQLSWEIANSIQYFSWTISEKFAVSISWVVTAVILMVIGMSRDVKGIRYIALGLFGITTAKVLLYDLSDLAVIYRVLILMIVGAILVGVSFLYQNLNKGGASE